MTSSSTLESRARDLFLWAVGIAGGGILLAVVVRLVPSEAVRTAGLMFIPLLVPVVAVLALIAAVLAVVVLVRTRRSTGMKRLGLTITLVGSVLLVVLIPALVLITQILVSLVGQLVG